MAKFVVPSRVVKLATDYLRGTINGRKSPRLFQDLSTAELNELAELTRRQQASQSTDAVRTFDECLNPSGLVCP